ncbi:MAG: PQQ-dependent sugar dehydrogenase [Myxococcota bacterium]
MRVLRYLVVGVLLGVGLLLAVLSGACTALLPERFAVNAPMLHQMFGWGAEPASVEQLEGLHAPPGFTVGLWATDLPNARFLRFTEAGDLLVSTPRSGRIRLLLRDADGDGRSDGTRTLLSDLDRPHGMDFHEGWLYVGESGAVGRVRFDARARAVDGDYERVIEGLPAGGNHWTRTVRFGPDGGLYVSIGSSCNVCEESDPRRAAIVRYRPDGSGEEIFASGLRNAVGFDWQPGTGALYATDNGRDLLGDDYPPCELNRVERGGFYGWPYANGDRDPDPDYGSGHAAEIEASIPPAHGFRAHNAPLGITFVRGDRVPADLRGAALVALHGSWNRTRKDGYSVVSLHWDGERIEERDFLTGFLRGERVVGRPVDVAEGPDGAFYVSDDYGGAIYRIAYGETARTSPAGATAVRAAAPDAGSEPLGPAERAAAARRGAEIYDAHPCATCHESAAAAPGVVVFRLEALSDRYDTDGLATFLAAPTPPMPAFDLSAAERRDLAVHLLERHP